MKEETIQGIEGILAKDFEIGFHWANTEFKSGFSHFLEIALMGMIRQETLYAILMKSIDWFSQTKAFMNTHTEELCHQKAYTQHPVESTRKATNTNIEEVMERKDDEDIEPLQLGTQSSFPQLDDG